MTNAVGRHFSASLVDGDSLCPEGGKGAAAKCCSISPTLSSDTDQGCPILLSGYTPAPQSSWLFLEIWAETAGLGCPAITLGMGGESKQDSAQYCRDQLLQRCLADGAQEGDHLFLSEALNFL